MIKAIIFDFDGVILESADVKTRAFRMLFENDYPNHVDKIMEYHFHNMGISRFVKFKYFYETILNKPYTEKIENSLGKRFSEIVMDEILSTPFVSGAHEFLKSHGMSYSFFVASGSEENELKYIIKEREIYKFFKEIHGGHRKKPEIIKDIMKRYSLLKDEIIFIGDAESDLKAAEELELPFFIARIDGDNSQLKDCKYQIPDLTKLNSLIKSINQLF